MSRHRELERSDEGNVVKIPRCARWLRVIPATLLAACLSTPIVMAEQLLRFDFNDAADPNVAVDGSGNENNGILEGAAYTGPGGGVTGAPGDLALDLGDFNNGAYLDLTDIALDGAFDSIVENDKATIAFWLFGNDQQPQSQWTFWFGPDRQLGSHAPWGDGTVYFDVAGCCGANQRISRNIADPSLYSGQWNHFTYVKDETYTAVYINGELFVDSGDNEKDPLFDITEAAFGADATGGASHGGLMDDIGVWDEALDSAAIQEIIGEAPPTYIGGRGTIGNKSFMGDRSNEMFGPEESGLPGWRVTLVDSDLTIDSHTIAEDVLDDPAETRVVGSYDVVDLAGGGGSFPVNHPYPNGATGTSMEDFAIRAEADVEIPVGTYSIAFGSDDGGQLTIEGVEFDFDNSLNNDSFDDDQIRFEGNRGHGWTVGSFEVSGEPLTTTITASMHERGGGDSFEIAVIEGEIIEPASPDLDWELLGDEVLGWSVKHTAAPLVSADLSAAVAAGRPLQFDVNGDTNMADQLVIENPDPNVFTTILDVDGVTFQIAATGAVADGDSFTIIGADQIVGTPVITSIDPAQNWVFDPSSGLVCLGSCPGNVAGDYNGNGMRDAEDIEILSAAVRNGETASRFDLNGDGMVSLADRTEWVEVLTNTYFGDSNFDGEFSSSDFVTVFVPAKYETGQPATWSEGDWNGDGLFNSSDFVAAFTGAGYENGPRDGGLQVVPEPSAIALILFGILGLSRINRRS